MQPVQTLPGIEQPVSGKGKPQQNPGEVSLILKHIQFCAYFLSRNFFVTNRCLNLGQGRVRRICRDPETLGGSLKLFLHRQRDFQVLGTAAGERRNEHDTEGGECNADEMGQHQQRIQVKNVLTNSFTLSKHNRERIGESSRARDLLQTHLVEAGREATRLRRRIRELKSNLQDKLAPVKVSLQMDRAS